MQPSFADLGTALSEVTFCVLDLETTGSSTADAITEFGAVKVRGGVVQGEFQTLVNPGSHIPAVVALLTGITDSMVANAPRIQTVLPSFLEFCRGTVLVAHNARFDIGHLRRNCAALDLEWPGNHVVDTLALARQALLRDEVPNCKLATLATHFRTDVEPNHRALSDARATVDVLHGLLERVGNLGVLTLEDLTEFGHRVSPQRRAKRQWADPLPPRPGVYFFFTDHSSPSSKHPPLPDGREVLYVGKSVNVARRVRSYFTASEKRARMEEMVRVATGVESIECATPLEAEIRELRMIQAHSPRYNRRSRRQDKVLWVKLTDDAFPRLSIVGKPTDEGGTYWGPFASRAQAEQGVLALQDAWPLRRCTQTVSRRPRRPQQSGCMLLQLGKCLGPCVDAAVEPDYSALVAEVREAVGRDVRPTLGRVGHRLGKLCDQQRYEEAAELNNRLRTYAETTLRWHRLTSLAGCAQIVAAERSGDDWHLHVIRHGRLAAAAVAHPGDRPRAVADQALHLAETVLPPPAGLPAASVEEAERVASWLEHPGVRLIDIQGDWSWPLNIAVSAADLPRHVLGGGRP